ncbi:MAG: DUF2764 domain-containing protein [Chitinispirillaceae bacterium]|jgi:hypothetical protein|nr:DUF2764 domain-containing protein [Chitinispirillaceae bacterium]
MAREYHFLVAGLPDIVLDERRQALSFREFVIDVREWIDPADAALIRYFQYPSDNANVLRLITKSGAGFDPNGTFATEDELAHAVKSGDDMPDYLAAFLAAQRESRPLFDGRSPQDVLAWLFYDEATAHENEFIRDWFSTDLHLRNVIAALNCRFVTRQQQKSPEEGQTLISRTVICANEITDALTRSSAPDFGLGAKLSWFERVLGLDNAGLLERERHIDGIRWSILDDLTILSGFGIESILAYVARLAMAERWQEREADRGKKLLETLVTDLSAWRNA